MRLYLDTSTPETILQLDDKEYRYTFANNLAEKLLSFIQDRLSENNKSFSDITEITFMYTITQSTLVGTMKYYDVTVHINGAINCIRLPIIL